MNKLKNMTLQAFFSKELDFRVRLFNILAIAGIAIAFTMCVLNIVTEAGMIPLLMSLASALVSIALLIYSYKTGRYQRCYLITITAIFLILFPFMFFAGGGYHGGMPSFFVFAIVFTVFMLDGVKVIIMSALEIVVYISSCIVAYYHPELVRFFSDELSLLMDIMVAFSLVSVVLGVTMFLHFRLYNRQQRELEAAREEAVKFSEAKSAFLANTSHEIRTPINIILGMNEMILRESRSPEIREYALSVQNAGNTLMGLINNVLDVSKIEARKFEVSEVAYNTADLIRELSAVGTRSVIDKDISFELKLGENIPSELCGDYTRIKQVGTNFLSNAAKYTQDGSITLGFDWEGDSLVISVADTGMGIDEEHLPLLFESFTRIGSDKEAYIEGSGLGLSIARQLTELMGGKIEVQSVPGEGSVFTLRVPQTVTANTPLDRLVQLSWENVRRDEAGFIAPDGRILVVDDNGENLLVMKSLLRRTMLRIDTASSGRECLDRVEKTKYDLILLDYMMPQMDGKQTLGRLRELPGFETPVVVLTANVVAGVKQELLDAGFTRYLSKPIMWNELERMLEELLPGEIVSKSYGEEKPTLTHSQMKVIAKQLGEYSVTMDDGLRYLGGDVLQFAALAGIFIDSYPESRREIEDCAARCDWAKMKYGVHALNSKARAIGANELCHTAKMLESLCDSEQSDYIIAMLPLLRYEWELAARGLRKFVAAVNEALPETAPAGGEADMEELLVMLRHNRHYDAELTLRTMMRIQCGDEEREVLLEALRMVEDMDYRQAEQLLRDFDWSGRSNG